MERTLPRKSVSDVTPHPPIERHHFWNGRDLPEVLRRILQELRLPECKIVLWNGQEWSTCRDEPKFLIRIHTPHALNRLAADLEMGFAEGYVDGSIEVEGNLVACLSAAFLSWEQWHQPSLARKVAWKVFRISHRNTLAGSRRNIAAHYDLSNDFYRLWLDREMMYTCAYYPEPSCTLEQAQQAKMELICRKLQLQPGQHVVEAGCGWGGFALYAAKHYGVTVRAFNISPSQIGYARDRARRENLSDRVEFIEDDYRNIRDQCDVFVSIGMLEHVGPEHYPDLGAVIENSLRKGGRGLLHFIGRSKPQPLDPWIARHIFPGAHPPSLGEMLPLLEKRNMVVTDIENLRLHYARTAQHWLERFECHRDEVEQLKGAEFVRMWRLYLAGTHLAFLHGTLQLFQVTFSRGPCPGEPLTREHLHQPAEGEVKRWNLSMPS